MKQYAIRQVVMISEIQSESLTKLKSYNVNISQFIRQAIKEKIQRDWKTIKDKRKEIFIPF